MSVTVTMETVMPFAMLMPKRQDGLVFCPPLGLFVLAVRSSISSYFGICGHLKRRRNPNETEPQETNYY